jgi:hypothetical protein
MVTLWSLVAAGCIGAEPDGDDGVETVGRALTGDPCRSNAQCDDGNPCNTDRCVGGKCAYAAKPDGTTCNDRDRCTKTDVCRAGVCVGGEPVTCAPANQCQTSNGCDPGTGKCAYFARSGAACDDGNSCTQNDRCTSAAAGVCKGTRRSRGSSCDDGNSCTGGDQCTSGGVCVGAAKPAGTSCDDGDAKTVGDVCTQSGCVGADHCLGVTCPPPDQCHVQGVCVDHATGACSSPVGPDGQTCDDGLPATTGDVCTNGACAGTPIQPLTFDFACETSVAKAAVSPDYFVMTGERDGLLVVEDPALVKQPFQDATGAVHVPIGYRGPLVLNVRARYTNDTATAVKLVGVHPYGFSHQIGQSQLQYPTSGDQVQGTFETTWAAQEVETVALAPGASVERGFFEYRLNSAGFGPTIAAMTTDYGWSSPAHTLVAGEKSRFVCQVLGGSIESGAGVDVTAPTLVGMTLSPESIDTGGSSATVSAALTVFDDLSGFGPAGTFRGDMFFNSPSGSQSRICRLRSPGPATSGVMTCSMSFPRYSEAGTWAITYLYFTDDVGNTRRLTVDELRAAGIPTTISVTGTQDTAPPTLAALTIAPDAIDTTASGATVTLTLSMEDDLSGFAPAGTFVGDIFFNGPAAQSRLCRLLSPGPGLSATASCDMSFPARSEAGVWTISYLYFTDNVGNTQRLTAEALQAAGFPIAIDVRSDPDTTPPTLQALTISPPAIDTRAGGASVSLTLAIADDASGFAAAGAFMGDVFFNSPTGQQSRLCRLYAPGPGLSASVTCQMDFPAFSESGTWSIMYLYFTDAVGNSQNLTVEELQLAGFPVSIQVD